jgi:hypothetical protein
MDFDPLERIALACFASATVAFLSGVGRPTFLAAGLAAGMVLLTVGLAAFTTSLARSVVARCGPSRSA